MILRSAHLGLAHCAMCDEVVHGFPHAREVDTCAKASERTFGSHVSTSRVGDGDGVLPQNFGETEEGDFSVELVVRVPVSEKAILEVEVVYQSRICLT